MHSKVKTVWYCDFCKAKRFMKSAMERHEKHCTMNPGRACRLCEYTDETGASLEDLIAICKSHIPIEGKMPLAINSQRLEADLREATDCPACIMAALRQSGCMIMPEFDYKKEVEKVFEIVREEEAAYIARGCDCYGG